MRSLLCGALLAGLVTPLGAQDAPPAPTSGPRPQFVAFYFGASDCVPCRDPELKTALGQMRERLTKVAAETGHEFAMVGVALDARVDSALALLRPATEFDAIVTGDSWMNFAAERFIWGDPSAAPLIPQVVVVERVRAPGPQGGSQPRVVRRIFGAVEIERWVREGTPLSFGASAAPEPSRGP